MQSEMLVESRTARETYSDRVEVLEKVGTLALLPDGLHADRASVARFYGVDEEALYSVIRRHRDELTENGMRVIAGQEFLVNMTSNPRGGRPRATVFTKRAVLNIGMLLRDSDVAKQVRSYLLNVEELSSPEDRQSAVIGQAETDAIATQLAKHLEGLLSAEREKTTRAITAAFTPRTVTAIATEQRQGSQPLGDFRNAIVQAADLRSVREAMPYLVAIGAIRPYVRDSGATVYYVCDSWSDVLEDTVIAGKRTQSRPGVVRVRAGMQQAFMDRVRERAGRRQAFKGCVRESIREDYLGYTDTEVR